MTREKSNEVLEDLLIDKAGEVFFLDAPKRQHLIASARVAMPYIVDQQTLQFFGEAFNEKDVQRNLLGLAHELILPHKVSYFEFRHHELTCGALVVYPNIYPILQTNNGPMWTGAEFDMMTSESTFAYVSDYHRKRISEKDHLDEVNRQFVRVLCCAAHLSCPSTFTLNTLKRTPQPNRKRGFVGDTVEVMSIPVRRTKRLLAMLGKLQRNPPRLHDVNPFYAHRRTETDCAKGWEGLPRYADFMAHNWEKIEARKATWTCAKCNSLRWYVPKQIGRGSKRRGTVARAGYEFRTA